MFLEIGGTGGMAHATASESKNQGVEHAFWNGAPNVYRGDEVAIHVGRKERLIEMLAWCERTGCPLIHAASGLDDFLPPAPSFAIVRAPNLSLRIVYLMEALRLSTARLKKDGASVRIQVSHQLTKLTPPGTAHAIADLFGIPTEAIDTLRTREAQKDFGVPEAHLERHSYHYVELRSPECMLELKIGINGLREYAEGALAIASALDKYRSDLELKDGGIFSVPYILGLDEKKTVPG